MLLADEEWSVLDCKSDETKQNLFEKIIKLDCDTTDARIYVGR